jgi:hypothetical protein
VGSFSDALGRAREDSSVQKLIKDPQVTEHIERRRNRELEERARSTQGGG